jgi:hypothetical protein
MLAHRNASASDGGNGWRIDSPRRRGRRSLEVANLLGECEQTPSERSGAELRHPGRVEIEQLGRVLQGVAAAGGVSPGSAGDEGDEADDVQDREGHGVASGS